MSELLPDLPDAPSGWNTANHYFYEIVNQTGQTTYIQFAISAQNITDEFRAICEKINQFYPTRINKNKENWQWRVPFRTATVQIAEDLSKEEVFAILDSCMNEILAFEADLIRKMQ